MDKQIAETERTESQQIHSRRLLREWVDWVLVVGAAGLLPMVWLHCQDLWFRSDLKFFPICLVAFVVLVVWKARLGEHRSSVRSYFAIASLIAAVVAGALSAAIFSPWLALLALTLVLVGWMLQRIGVTAWYEVVGWTLPLWVMLLFPLSDIADATSMLEDSVASSSSAVLDAIGVPQLATGNTVEVRSGVLSTMAVCRGLGNPYLLLILVVLLSMIRRQGIFIGFLTVLSVPLWAWFGALLHMVVGLYLLEADKVSLFYGNRGWIAQGVTLLVVLISIGLFQFALRNCLSPFTAYSQTAGGFHKFFNWVAYWPQEDPLRPRSRRQSASASDREPSGGNLFGHTYVRIGLGIGVLLFAGTGGWALFQMFGSRSASRMYPLHVPVSTAQNGVERSDLPADLGGMKQIAFSAVERPESHFSKRLSYSWTYMFEAQQVAITVDLPLRGFFPVERSYRSPVRRIADPRQSSVAASDSPKGDILVDELVFLDKIYGQSYLCYATFTLNDFSPKRTSVSEAGISFQSFANSISLQPTVVAVHLFVEGSGEPTEEDRTRLRKTLLDVCDKLELPLREMFGD